MALPQQFIDNIKHLATLEPRVNGLLEALSTTSPSVSVRFNRAKVSDLPDTVAGEPSGDPVPWCTTGRYLNNRPLFTLDPALHQGLFYVQDASSMFISHVINSLTANTDTPLVYLDACAAPGGKTTAAIDALPHGSLVVANEWDYRRAEILRENITKWGHPSTVVTRGDTKRYRKLRSTFDIIAADVPCSGEGMMRKDAEAVAQWTPALVTECAERQREILDNLWPALKPGGYLIYSTCTFNRAENEEVIDYLIDTYDAIPVTIPMIDDTHGILPGIGTTHPCYRFMPHRVVGEGLFMAVVRKPGEDTGGHRDNAKDPRPAKLPFKLPAWIPSSLHTILDGDTLYGIPSRWKPLIDRLLQNLDVIQPGVELATVKGRDLIPSQGLAMSTILDTANIDTVEVDTPTALAYLRRDTVTLPPDTPRGHI
ncbi:MAG: hypothetical protein K2I52_06765, partial [Muribaculaceae bacterium]|nr:hypothetical protein [Muribaculaceae bacterium]